MHDRMTMHSRQSSAMLATRRTQQWVAPFMIAALASLLTGLWAGLARIGWALPDADSALMLRHGGLMVVGFAGTVIGVERAVAVRSIPAFAAPAFSAACGMSLVAGAPPAVPPALAAAAGAAYVVNMATLSLRHRTLPFYVMLAGAICLTAAAVAWWHGGGLPRVVPWWIAFLALTIGAERLELLRFQHLSRTAVVVGSVSLLVVVAGPAVGVLDGATGARVLGVGLISSAAWLGARDHARRGVRSDGLTRYIAVGLLAAYTWLAITGLMLVAWGLSAAGGRYDAVVHAFFIGVVMSAIFAHEPIIAPSVSGLDFPYSPWFYAPLLLIESGLVTRIAGDLLQQAELRRWSGLVQTIAIVLLLAITAWNVIRARRHPA